MDPTLNDRHGCGSGAFVGGLSLKDMLAAQQREMRPSSSCVWPGAPQDGADRSNCMYNELVIKGEVFEAALPEALEAIFYPTRGVVHHPEGSATTARDMRRRFLEAFPNTRVPLVSYDLEQATSRQYDSRPWRLEEL